MTGKTLETRLPPSIAAMPDAGINDLKELQRNAVLHELKSKQQTVKPTIFHVKDLNGIKYVSIDLETEFPYLKPASEWNYKTQDSSGKVWSLDEARNKMNFRRINQISSIDSILFDTLGIDIGKDTELFYEACKHPDNDSYVIMNAQNDYRKISPDNKRIVFNGHQVREYFKKHPENFESL